MLPLILAPMFISCLYIAMGGAGDAPLAMKSTIAFGLSCFIVIVAQLYAPKYAVEMLTGIALITILHAALGAYQMFMFTRGVFPFPEIYINQSFLSVQENAEIIARYTQRPFGLFPEPSAMSSSLAPFILFWIAMSCGIVKLRREPAKWQSLLFHLAAAGGLGLMIISRSGHCAVTLAAAGTFGLIWFIRCKATAKNYLVLVGVLGIVLPVVLYFAVMSLSDRVGDTKYGNDSWEERSTSLRLGYEVLINGGPMRLLFGVGPGQISPAIWKMARIDSVFSVSLVYIYESGWIAAMAAAVIAFYLMRQWISSGRNIALVAIAVVWLVGVTVTTSYSQLLPLWIALGWMSVWNTIVQPADPRKKVGMR
jgi:hypothetical protein